MSVLTRKLCQNSKISLSNYACMLQKVQSQRLSQCNKSINHTPRFYSGLSKSYQEQQTHSAVSGNELFDTFSLNVNQKGHQVAFVVDEQHVTFERLYKSSLECAIYLRETFDLKPGDVISCISWNGHCPQIQAVMIASHILNTVFMPINTTSSVQSMQQIIENTKSPLIICDEAFYKDKYHEFTFDENKQIPSVLVHKGIQTNETPIEWIGAQFMQNTSIQSMQQTVTDIMKLNYNQYLESDNIAVMLPTSGTTAIPKLVTHSTRTITNVIASFHNSFPGFFDETLMEMWCGGSDTKTIINSSPYHGLWYFVMANPMTSMHHCMYYPTQIMRARNTTNNEKTKDLMRLIEETEMTALFLGVSPVYELVKIQKQIGSHMRFILTGGDIVHPAMVQKLMKLMPPQTAMMNGYGCTECGAIAGNLWRSEDNMDMHQIKHNLLSLKRMKSVESMKINAASNELEVKSNAIMLGYYNNASKNKEVLTDDGYYRTGDVIEDVNYEKDSSEISSFRIVARNVDFIITETAHIQPQNIENVLLSHEKVNGAAVVGVECNIIFSGDDTMANVGYKYPVAYVTVSDENREVNNDKLIEELFELCNDNLSKQKKEIPYTIFIVDEFPVNAIGKILRRELLDTATQYFTQKKSKY